LVTPLGQDPASGVGDGDDATNVAHFMGDGRGPKTQLSEDDIVFGRTVEVRDSYRSLCQTRVHSVLLSAAMPGDRHLGPDTRDLILALHESFPRGANGGAGRVRRRWLEPIHISHGG
jgi:hypothetical protein